MKRAFILGAGFSKPAGMPVATELLQPLIEKADHDEMQDWLEHLQERVAWIAESKSFGNRFQLNIEQVFHLAHFDSEAFRLKQHLCPLGRYDGDTPWDISESIDAWLSYLEEDLQDLILEYDQKSDLAPITRWAGTLTRQDAVLTFNYDTLVERAIANLGMQWNHATGLKDDCGIAVHKLHGSIDWIVADCTQTFSKLDLLFEKKNFNRTGGMSGHVEDDFRLWRCTCPKQLRSWINGRDLQSLPKNAFPRSVGIAGLGAYKQLHTIPGLGHVWHKGAKALYDSDLVVIVGFSMSDFDAMAQMQFADVARGRAQEDNSLRVIVINPGLDEATEERFRRVFRSVEFVKEPHERFDWSKLA